MNDTEEILNSACKCSLALGIELMSVPITKRLLHILT
jgi:hypothetical protein